MRRSRLQVKLDVLSALTNKPLKITHIMYKATVNCTVLKDYLEVLIETCLVEALPDNRKGSYLYQLTTKGRDTLKLYNTVLKRLGEEEKVKSWKSG